MAPRYVQILLIEKPRTLAKLQLGKGDVGRIDTEIERTVMRRPQTELKEMNAFPAHRHLNDPMYLAQRKGGRKLKAPSDHWTDVQQPDLELQHIAAYLNRNVTSPVPR